MLKALARITLWTKDKEPRSPQSNSIPQVAASLPGTVDYSTDNQQAMI